MSSENQRPRGAYVVAVDLGYGHQRAAFPLVEKMAVLPAAWQGEPRVISANNYPGIPVKDHLIWSGVKRAYEGLSRFDSWPFFGKRVFHLMDALHQIPPFYPRRDLTKPTGELEKVYALIRRGVGRHFIDVLNAEPLPLIASFPVLAFFAEEHGYKGDIYCLCTDTDVARAWAPLQPKKSRIVYLAPTVRARERLKLYGVRPENIVLTGFPLPSIHNEETAKVALARRIRVLDRRGRYQKKYGGLLQLYVGALPAGEEPAERLTIMFSVGGAGAQWEIGVTLAESLKGLIQAGTIRLILAAGTLKNVRDHFEAAKKRLGLASGCDILYEPDKFVYFKRFGETLAETDILWTKPSELSFYVGLGVPIIMAPPLGAQEEANKAWLAMVGAGTAQFDPRYAHEWLADWLDSGWLAAAAVNGFLNAPKHAVNHIENLVIRGIRSEIEDIHFL